MKKLYQVELKGVGEIIADIGTLENFMYLLDQAYCYCDEMSEKTKYNERSIVHTLYEWDKINIEVSKSIIANILATNEV